MRRSRPRRSLGRNGIGDHSRRTIFGGRFGIFDTTWIVGQKLLLQVSELLAPLELAVEPFGNRFVRVDLAFVELTPLKSSIGDRVSAELFAILIPKTGYDRGKRLR